MTTKVSIDQFDQNVVTNVALDQRYLVFTYADGTETAIDLKSARAAVAPPVVFYGSQFGLSLSSIPGQYVMLAEIEGTGVDNVGPFVLDGSGNQLITYTCSPSYSLGLHRWRLTFSDGQEAVAVFIVAGSKYHPVARMTKTRYKQGEAAVYNIAGARPQTTVKVKKIGPAWGDLPQGEAYYPELIAIDDQGRATNTSSPEIVPENALGEYRRIFYFADGQEQEVSFSVEAATVEEVFNPVIVSEKSQYDKGDSLVWFVTGGKPNTTFVLYKETGGDYGGYPANGVQYTLDQNGEASNRFDTQNQIPDGASGSYTFKAVFLDNQESRFTFSIMVYNKSFTYNKTTVTQGQDTLTWVVAGAKPSTQITLRKMSGGNWNGQTAKPYTLDTEGRATATETISSSIAVGAYTWRCEFWDGSYIDQAITVQAAPAIPPSTGDGTGGGTDTGGGTTIPVQFQFTSAKYVQPEVISAGISGPPNAAFNITFVSGPQNLFDANPQPGTTDAQGIATFNLGTSSSKKIGKYKYKATFVTGQSVYQEIEIVGELVPGILQIVPATMSRSGVFNMQGASSMIQMYAYYNKRPVIVKVERVSGPSVTPAQSAILGGGAVYVNEAVSYPSGKYIYNSRGVVAEDGKSMARNNVGVGTYVLRATFDNGTTATATFTVTN